VGVAKILRETKAKEQAQTKVDKDSTQNIALRTVFADALLHDEDGSAAVTTQPVHQHVSMSSADTSQLAEVARRQNLHEVLRRLERKEANVIAKIEATKMEKDIK